MTGRQWKQFAESIPDDCVVERELGAVRAAFKELFDHDQYRTTECVEWVPLPVSPLRVVITPDVVHAARVANRLTEAPVPKA